MACFIALQACRPKVYLPKLNTKIPCGISLFYPQVKNTVDEWSIRYTCPKNPIEEQFLIEKKYPELTALLYPNASPRCLILIAKLFVALFAVDDLMDKPDYEDHMNFLKPFVEDHKSIMAHDSRGHSRAITLKGTELEHMIDMYRDLWWEVNSTFSVPQRERFGQWVSAFMDCSMQRSPSELARLNSYIEKRRGISAVGMMFPLAEFAGNYDIPKEVLDRPGIKQLERVCVDHMMLFNDLISFKKEWKDGAQVNIIKLISTLDKCSHQDAVFKVYKMLYDLEDEFYEAKAQEQLKEYYDAKVSDYIQGMEYMMSANIEWSWGSARYHGINWVAPPEKYGTLDLM